METKRQGDRETGRQGDRDTERQRYRETGDRETGERETRDRGSGRHAGRLETGRETGDWYGDVRQKGSKV